MLVCLLGLWQGGVYIEKLHFNILLDDTKCLRHLSSSFQLTHLWKLFLHAPNLHVDQLVFGALNEITRTKRKNWASVGLFHIKPAHRFSAVVIEHGRSIINQCYSWLCKTMNMCRCLLHRCIKVSKFTTVFTITEKFLKGWANRNHLTIITGSGLTFFQRVKTWEKTSLIFLQQQSEDETAALTICNNICCTFKHPFSPSEEKAESPLHNQMSFKNPLRTLRTYRRIWKQTLCIFNVPDIQVNHICFSV